MAKHPMDNIEPGIKVTAQMSPEPTEEDLQFTKQMGVEYVVLWTDGEHANYDYFMSRREIFENAGLKIYGFGNSDVHNQDAIVLNLPNRDAKIEQYNDISVTLAAPGFPTPPTRTWATVSGVRNVRQPVAARVRGDLT